MPLGTPTASAQSDGDSLAAVGGKEMCRQFGVLAMGQRERGGLHNVSRV